MISTRTWPNFRGSERDGTSVIAQHLHFADDVQYGKTKLFIKSPQTVFRLEEERDRLIPGIVIYLQVGGACQRNV